MAAAPPDLTRTDTPALTTGNLGPLAAPAGVGAGGLPFIELNRAASAARFHLAIRSSLTYSEGMWALRTPQTPGGRAARDVDSGPDRASIDAALRASEDRFAKAFEYAPTGMALVGIDGAVLKVTRALCEMFGYPESEMVQIPVWRITHPDDMPATIEQLQRLLENEIDTWVLEKRYFHRDGHLLWGRSTTWLVRDAHGAAQYVVSQVQDITDCKRLEEQTRQLQVELAHALRVATMGETLAQIAHEMNQPLASIANFANGLIVRWGSEGVDAATSRAVVAQIADEALRAGAIIRHLRGFLRKGEAARTLHDANHVVRDTVRLVEADVRQHAIRLTLELTRSPAPVAIDRVQVGQVLLNLLRNAIDALLPQPAPARALAVGTEVSGGGEVSVVVSDSGVGLPDAPDGAIFEPFFTTKADGLGLGLSISRSIVEAHGGKLWARHNAECGTTVGFTLPSGS